MSESDANVRAALREVRKHGQERDLLVALLREMACESEIVWSPPDGLRKLYPDCPPGVLVEVIGEDDGNPHGYWITVEQDPMGRHAEDEELNEDGDAIGLSPSDLLPLILSLARFLPREEA